MGPHRKSPTRQRRIGHDPGTIYRGPSFRIGTNRLHLVKKTALDVIRYEVEGMGCEDVHAGYLKVRELLAVKFSDTPAGRLVWIYPIQKRGSVRYFVPRQTVIVCNRGDRGVLLLLPKMRINKRGLK